MIAQPTAQSSGFDIFDRLSPRGAAWFSAWASEIDSRLQVGGDKALFSVKDHTQGIYERNPNCWAKDVDLTPLSPWNSQLGGQKAGTLLSPRHIAMATHYPLPAGAVVRFVTADNVTVERTISTTTAFQDTFQLYPDITIGLLDSDVPESIGFVRVLPPTWQSYMPAFLGKKVPALVTDQEGKALVQDINFVGTNHPSRVDTVLPTNELRARYYESLVAGDSGQPGCLISQGRLIMLKLASGSAIGTFWTTFYNEINTAMNNLGGGYQLTPVTLTSS